MFNRSITLAHCFIFLMLAVYSPAMAVTWIDRDEVKICPASSGDLEKIPNFSSPGCYAAKASAIDPQENLIWVKANLTLNETSGPVGEPLALFVSGKMASAFYLNGRFVGQNGKPGIDAATEQPGLMDATLYPSQNSFREGRNSVVFLASAHHGIINLASPIHMIAIGPAGNASDQLLRHYWPSIITLGLFIVGAVYFGIAGIRGLSRKKSLLLSLICTFASLQLFSEILRGLVTYSYPMHDWRLLAITVFSAGFGLTVAFHVFSTFMQKNILLSMIFVTGVSVLAAILNSGFDDKTLSVMLLPLVASLIVAGYASYKGQPRAFVYFCALLAFVAAIGLFPYLFLDTIFFYLVAALLLFLFVEQALAHAREADERRIEEARANRLELALEQAKEREQATEISVKSAGRMERISAVQIKYCKGASGYTEIVLIDGREILHTATLSEMEELLPTIFIRVHRSYLVNTAFVQTLIRDVTGTGRLTLVDGSQLSVSRRTMPAVRKALG
ncbi:LytTR family transcriptional regulator DNA-binding domain-containing protein [Sphingorhabdus sp. Alg231-15]|uniref:LytTR family transcriptional regulator DNA-binding domain-containing protein n=1 Tax=Sphingorhabdus sp. Alg231-15 TaxID=1922222 RepID=UPI000D55D9E0